MDSLWKKGDRIGGEYLITRVVHQSEESTLYQAVADDEEDLIYAIKESPISKVDGLTREQYIDDFILRGRLFQRIKHPAISDTYDCFVEENHLYLACEFIEGKDLEKHLMERKDLFPVEDVIRWGITLAAALEYLHTHKPDAVIFRDLKPANIVLDSEGEVHLVDMGIAGVFPQGITLDPLGTDGYAAPEQYNGIVTPEIDIYALGATLHHLLSGVDPRFEEPFSYEERPIQPHNPEVSPKLEQIIMEAAAYDSSSRIQTARALKERLITIV